MAKPASSRCNLDCHYCFYIDKPSQPVMDNATLEAFICQHIAAQPVDDVLFAWQGGEPTLCGLDFSPRGRVAKTLWRGETHPEYLPD